AERAAAAAGPGAASPPPAVEPPRAREPPAPAAPGWTPAPGPPSGPPSSCATVPRLSACPAPGSQAGCSAGSVSAGISCGSSINARISSTLAVTWARTASNSGSRRETPCRRNTAAMCSRSTGIVIGPSTPAASSKNPSLSTLIDFAAVPEIPATRGVTAPDWPAGSALCYTHDRQPAPPLWRLRLVGRVRRILLFLGSPGGYYLQLVQEVINGGDPESLTDSEGSSWTAGLSKLSLINILGMPSIN